MLLSTSDLMILPVNAVSSVALTLKLPATGASLTAPTLMVTVAVLLSRAPSFTL